MTTMNTAYVEFKEILDEWTEACLAEHRSASNDPEVITTISRLGLLGQRLIYRANQAGVHEATKIAREVISDYQSK